MQSHILRTTRSSICRSRASLGCQGLLQETVMFQDIIGVFAGGGPGLWCSAGVRGRESSLARGWGYSVLAAGSRGLGITRSRGSGVGQSTAGGARVGSRHGSLSSTLGSVEVPEIYGQST